MRLWVVPEGRYVTRQKDRMKDEYPPLQVKNFPTREKRWFRARALELGMSMKAALIEAMRLWLDANPHNGSNGNGGAK